MSVKLVTSANELWKAWSGNAASGRFECPITIFDRGQNIQVTHIYRGYGVTRLEFIKGDPVRSKKGFQGEDVTPNDKTFIIFD